MKLSDAFEYFDCRNDGVITFEEVRLHSLNNIPYCHRSPSISYLIVLVLDVALLLLFFNYH